MQIVKFILILSDTISNTNLQLMAVVTRKQQEKLETVF